MIRKIMNKFFTKEVISYLIFGVLTTLVNFVCFRLLKTAFSGFAIAANSTALLMIINSLAWLAAVIFAYITNKLYVFKSKIWKFNVIFKEILSFGAARVLSLLFENLFLLLTVQVLHIMEMPAKIIASVFVVIINYIASKLFIFKKK